uniref:Uncharacterized protein n=1 Tax=Pyrodinium bahamense TaxID=73915 RepID=A0A7S0ALA8_9DINO|mmetsp:Transcript_36037/g.99949  ORF Transcript_36037/g.99949 Transcript_36037/m.99949 type:complete len:329 (+) Transcript_36037:152-1138(+)
MEEQQDPNEITKLQLSEKEEEFIGQCWDGIQDSGKLGMDGLGTLCDTLGITMDVINLAITGLGNEDLTMDCGDFMLLMGRMLRSGALVLPQAGESAGGASVAGAQGAAQSQNTEEALPTDSNEISKIKLSEREEDFIGQCWDGVKESGRLGMDGLRALSDTLGIDAEVINLAVTGLGSADCTMDRGEFMLLMGRLLRSGALKLPPEAAGANELEEQGEDKADAAKPAPAKAGMAAWMASMTAEGEDVDEAEATEAPAAKVGAAAWMASMTVDDGEDVDEPEAAKPLPTQERASAWMASMVPDEVAESKPAVGNNAWMASMAVDVAEDN